MLVRWYEMQCDFCGCAEHFLDTKADANAELSGGPGKAHNGEKP